ncbi:unnamed protein product [Cladocopium goreaui]|uniref:Uncharacterized protein n=1 Tax=Cladocopium goreaui TaxID=2562237 RepID=A0A9P1GPT2_9DINO|nr:unnamed protein product [Cladocopium goreaui]
MIIAISRIKAIPGIVVIPRIAVMKVIEVTRTRIPRDTPPIIIIPHDCGKLPGGMTAGCIGKLPGGNSALAGHLGSCDMRVLPKRLRFKASASCSQFLKTSCNEDTPSS